MNKTPSSISLKQELLRCLVQRPIWNPLAQNNCFFHPCLPFDRLIKVWRGLKKKASGKARLTTSNKEAYNRREQFVNLSCSLDSLRSDQSLLSLISCLTLSFSEHHLFLVCFFRQGLTGPRLTLNSEIYFPLPPKC